MTDLLGYQKECSVAFTGSPAETFLEKERGIAPATAASFGVGYDVKKQCVVFPYWLPDLTIHNFKLRDSNGQRYAERGKGVVPYGLFSLDGQDRVFICEGETDTLRLAQMLGTEEAVLGVPGAQSVACLEKYLPEGATLYVCFDTDSSGKKATAKVIEKYLAKPVFLPSEMKDICEYFQAGQTREDFLELVEEADTVHDLKQAVAEAEKQAFDKSAVKRLSGCHPSSSPDEQRGKNGQPPEQPDSCQVVRLSPEEREKAESILHSADPLELVRQAVRDMGYGGAVRTPLITYLAATSRLLKMREGSMPVHLLLVGQPSAGKSYAASLAASLLPQSAVYKIDAGSPRVLIYDETPLKHKLILFGEADSLPAGEDNPAASAVRNLLQDNRLHYKVVEKKGGRHENRVIEKEGPSVLITTAVKRLGPQLTSRLFVLDVPDDPNQIRAALRSQASIELNGAVMPSKELIAFQKLLQNEAPYNVLVPFAQKLAVAIGRQPAAARINRDYARLLSLIKAVAILRQAQRKKDEQGRIICELEDYYTVRLLIGDMFEASVTGAGEAVRETIEVAIKLIDTGQKTVSIIELAKALKVSKEAARKRVQKALEGRWFVNQEERRGHPYKLAIGEPLPDSAGLPRPGELTTRQPCGNGAGTRKHDDLRGKQPDNPETGDGQRQPQALFAS